MVQGSSNGIGSTPGAPIPTLEGTETTSSQVMVGSLGTTLPVISVSPFGYGLSAAQPAGTQRSSQVVRLPLQSRPGSLEISNGPAYGADILYSVALAWLLASLAVVLLAGGVGLFASWQVTQPVLALTLAAWRMQFGDLSSRVMLGRGRQAQEFRDLAETFNGMAQRVEDTVSTLRAFVSDAAHELNTPLTALHTNLELALNEPEDGQRKAFLGRVLEQNLRLEHLASGLLDLSRIDAARTSPSFETLDLAGPGVGDCRALCVVGRAGRAKFYP